MMKLSKSAVNTFRKCPREFKYRYIDKIEEEPNEYMQLGTDVHNIAEVFVQNADMDEEFFPQLMSIYTSSGSDFDLESHLQNLANFYDEVFKDENEPYYFFSAEEYIYDEEHNFSGLADLIVEDPDGNLIIIDYKTGSPKPISNYLLELIYYKMLVNYKYPNRKVISAGICFTKDGSMKFTNFCEKQKKGSFVDREDEETAINYLDYVRDEVREGNLAPKPQFLCDYCCYRERCKKDGGL